MKMKVGSKPISSPGRAEKYPPPLMRFLRSNVGSRSRGRSRSSPMFVRKKSTTNNTTTIETQEPTSPKVTCIGQVRVRRSKQTGAKPGRTKTPVKRRCRWLKHTLFCTHFNTKIKYKSFRPFFRKWVLFFQMGFRRKAQITEDSSKTESRFEAKDSEIDRELETSENQDQEEEEEDYNNNTNKFVSASTSPPKNALLLMRSRSAPYRSSSLATRFWESPVVTEEIAQKAEPKTECESENRGVEVAEKLNPTSERDPICSDSSGESRTDQESEESLELYKEFEGSSKLSARMEELKTGEVVCSVVRRPMILTRCKSEPARLAEKLDPEVSFWRKRRFGITDPFSPHVCD